MFHRTNDTSDRQQDFRLCFEKRPDLGIQKSIKKNQEMDWTSPKVSLIRYVNLLERGCANRSVFGVHLTGTRSNGSVTPETGMSKAMGAEKAVGKMKAGSSLVSVTSTHSTDCL